MSRASVLWLTYLEAKGQKILRYAVDSSVLLGSFGVVRRRYELEIPGGTENCQCHAARPRSVGVDSVQFRVACVHNGPYLRNGGRCRGWREGQVCLLVLRMAEEKV